MGYAYFADGASFLIESVLGIFIIALILRFLFQLVLTRADYGNPIWQGVVKATGWILHPLRRVIPGFRGVDVAAILLTIVVQMLEIYLVDGVNGVMRGPVSALILAIAYILNTVSWIFLGAVFIAVILSWVGSSTYNSFTSLVYGLSEPLLQPLREMLPPMGGLDLSPLVLIIGLQLVQKMLIAPLFALAYGIL